MEYETEFFNCSDAEIPPLIKARTEKLLDSLAGLPESDVASILLSSLMIATMDMDPRIHHAVSVALHEASEQMREMHTVATGEVH